MDELVLVDTIFNFLFRSNSAHVEQCADCGISWDFVWTHNPPGAIRRSFYAWVNFGRTSLRKQIVSNGFCSFHTGLLSGIIGLCVADYFEVQPHSPWISVGILLLSGLTMALLNLGFQVKFTCERALCDI